MATYGTYEGVRGILQRTFSWSTTEGKGGVTSDEVEPHLQRAESLLRARLGRYYRFPLRAIDGADTYPYPIKDIVEYLAAQYLAEDRFAQDDPNRSERAKELIEKAEDLINKIIAGETTLQANRRYGENHFTSGEIEPVRVSQKVLQATPPPTSK